MPHFAPLAVAPLRVASLAPIDGEPHVEADDPATSIFTDLRVAPSVVVPAVEPLAPALRLMQLAGTRMAFVTDPQQRTVGLVTAADLHGERPMLAASVRSQPHGELTVADVMTPLGQWPAIDAHALSRARVGDVLATFRATGRRYLLVTEADANGQLMLRGVFSANRAERALGQSIDEELRSRNFSELAAALSHA